MQKQIDFRTGLGERVRLVMYSGKYEWLVRSAGSSDQWQKMSTVKHMDPGWKFEVRDTAEKLDLEMMQHGQK